MARRSAGTGEVRLDLVLGDLIRIRTLDSNPRRERALGTFLRNPDDLSNDWYFFSLVHDVEQGKNVITLFLVDLIQRKQITLLDERSIDIVRDRVVIDGHQHGLLATTPAEFSHTFTCLRH